MSFIPIKGFDNYLINFPESSADNKDGDEHALEWGKSIFGAYTQGRGSTSVSTFSEVEMLRLYAIGNQPVEKYKKEIGHTTRDDTTGRVERSMYTNISFDNVNFYSQARDTVIAHLLKADNIVNVSCLDENSMSEKQERQWEMTVDRMIEPLYAEAGINKPTDEYVPQSQEEQDMYVQSGGLKLVDEISIETFCRKTLYDSDWEYTIRKQLYEDLWDVGIGVVRDTVNPFTQEVLTEYVDLQYAVIPYSKSPTFQDMPYCGHIAFITEQQLRKEAGPKHKDQITELIEHHSNGDYRQSDTMTLNPVETSSGSSLMIPVLRYEFRDCEYSQYEERESDKGTKYFKVPYDKKNKDTKKKKYHTNEKEIIRVCNWPLQADWVYGYKKKQDCPHGKNDKPRMSYHVFKMSGKSKGSQCVSIIDDIQLAVLRRRVADSVAAPDGFAYDIKALSNLKIGKKSWNPLELMTLHRQTGNLPFDSSVHPSQYQGASMSPIIPLSGGSGNYHAEQTNNIIMGVNQLREVSGINEFIAGTPGQNVDAPVHAQQQAVSAASNTIFGFFHGYSSIQRSLLENVAKRWQIIAINSEKSVNSAAIGEFRAEVFKLNAGMPLRSLGVYLNPKPSQQMIVDIRDHAMRSAEGRSQTGIGINTADLFFILRMLDDGNLKMAQLVLSHRIRKSEERQERIARENQQASQMAGVQNKKAEMEGKMQLQQMDNENKVTLQDKDAEKEFGLQTIEGEQKLEQISRAGAFKNGN